MKKDARTEMISVRLTPEEKRLVIQWGKAMVGLVTEAEAARDMILFAAAKGKKQ